MLETPNARCAELDDPLWTHAAHCLVQESTLFATDRQVEVLHLFGPVLGHGLAPPLARHPFTDLGPLRIGLAVEAVQHPYNSGIGQ